MSHIDGLPPFNANVNITQDPCGSEDCKDSAENAQWFSEGSQERIVVCYLISMVSLGTQARSMMGRTYDDEPILSLISNLGSRDIQDSSALGI